MNASKNLYKVIGCRADSTDEQRKSAYRAKMRLVHSDKGGNTDEAQAVNLAWEVLGDTAKHTEYKIARASWAKQLGAVLCVSCGDANRVPATEHPVVCGYCKTPLGPVPNPDQYAEVRAAAAKLINLVGAALLSRVATEVTRRLK